MKLDESLNSPKNHFSTEIDIVSLNKHSEIKMIGSASIRSILSMEETIGLMEEAFLSIAKGSSHIPLRSVVENPEKSTAIFFKPAFNKTIDRFSVKLLTQNENNRNKGIPTITGIVLLHDKLTGKIVSILDGDSITSLRTGAVSGMASKILANKDSKSLAVFGCGAQGETQVEAILAVRNIEKVFLYDINEGAGKELEEKLKLKYDSSFEFTNELSKLKHADIICTATGSSKALFDLNHIKPGVHINAIGAYKPSMQEIHPEIIKSCSLYVDQKEACISEAGDIIIPIQSGLISKNHVRGEIGEVLSGSVRGRISENEITVFKSVGVAIQDLFVANAVYEKTLIDKNE